STFVDCFAMIRQLLRTSILLNNAKAITGMMTANGGLMAMLTRLTDIKYAAQDSMKITPVVMSVAFSAGNTPANPVTGQTTTYSAHIPTNTADRAFYSVNLFTGAVANAPKILTADIILHHCRRCHWNLLSFQIW